jgi:hypothetical protein
MIIKVPVKSIVINASTLNLLHTDWTEVLAALNYTASHFEVYNGSTTPIEIAVGAAGKEEALPYTIMGGGTNGIVAQNIGASSRITLKPVDSDITDGFIVINLFTGVT